MPLLFLLFLDYYFAVLQPDYSICAGNLWLNRGSGRTAVQELPAKIATNFQSCSDASDADRLHLRSIPLRFYMLHMQQHTSGCYAHKRLNVR